MKFSDFGCILGIFVATFCALANALSHIVVVAVTSVREVWVIENTPMPMVVWVFVYGLIAGCFFFAEWVGNDGKKLCSDVA